MLKDFIDDLFDKYEVDVYRGENRWTLRVVRKTPTWQGRYMEAQAFVCLCSECHGTLIDFDRTEEYFWPLLMEACLNDVWKNNAPIEPVQPI